MTKASNNPSRSAPRIPRQVTGRGIRGGDDQQAQAMVSSFTPRQVYGLASGNSSVTDTKARPSSTARRSFAERSSRSPTDAEST